ncbi:Ovarian tumor [Macleaya cordata]|uniref:Ubiquitin thioesterase OTU n=1 Tax=Macleaya cordata TaxID=56857 RepID=A0A200Q2E5_MACCD|nr:Ovarian tumor [Macleaya cordata]
MLGVLCARPKSWIVAALSFAHGGVHHRIAGNPVSFVSTVVDQRRRVHSNACRLGSIDVPTASIWHAILPSGGDCRSNNLRPFHHEHKGEGSWNAALDVRPARWLHGSDSAWLLFGVCACLAPIDCCSGNHEAVAGSSDEGLGGGVKEEINANGNDKCSVDYRVTGVLADGRCLFRALAYGACLRSGEEAPDETRQRELADDLRARVVDELLKRREESEWFIEGDFDTYVKSIQDPNAWGGEPELIMASHVLQTPISVFMMDRSSGELVNITTYGQEYGKSKKPIKVLFHRYGHYDVLETLSDRSYQKIEK